MYHRSYFKVGRDGRSGMVWKLSTVLEQDHFCSAFLCSHETVLTNSQNHEDELSWRRTGKGRPDGGCASTDTGCGVDEHQSYSATRG